jgi:hypothetical protein
VNATLTAAVTPTPIVVVVTAVGGGVPIPTVTPDAGVQQTLAAATETLAAGSARLPARRASALMTPAPAAAPGPHSHGDPARRVPTPARRCSTKTISPSPICGT